MKKSFSLLCSITLSLFIAGCTNELSKTPDHEMIIDKTPLNIGFLSEQHFEKRYAQAFSIAHPDFRYHIIPMMDIVKKKTTVQQWYEKHSDQLDLLYVPNGLYQQFIDLGLIQDIEPFIRKDDYPLDDFVPAVLDLTRQYGASKLYGLAPSFNGQALVYNKGLFEANGVDLPRNGMSWEETLSLSNRFAKGLSITNSPLDLALEIGETKGLQLYDAKSKTLFADNPSWTGIWKSVLDSLAAGGVVTDDINAFPFLTGERAMAILSYDEYMRLVRTTPTFDWATVSMPVDAPLSKESRNLWPNGFYAIPQSSAHPEEAWELMKFFLSEDVAQWEWLSDYGFSTRLDILSRDLGQAANMRSFYQVDPIPSEERPLPDSFLQDAEKIMNQVQAGAISSDESLKLIQSLSRNKY